MKKCMNLLLVFSLNVSGCVTWKGDTAMDDFCEMNES